MRYALRQLLAVLMAVVVLVGEGDSAQALEHSFVKRRFGSRMKLTKRLDPKQWNPDPLCDQWQP